MEKISTQYGYIDDYDGWKPRKPTTDEIIEKIDEIIIWINQQETPN